LSLVLALGGTPMFWVTQPGGTGVWAEALGISHTADIIVPARTANLLLIVCSRDRRALMGSS
jgi:hypothetical protein